MWLKNSWDWFFVTCTQKIQTDSEVGMRGRVTLVRAAQAHARNIYIIGQRGRAIFEVR